MFVKSFMKQEVIYRKSAGDTVLKPMTVTFVDESIVSAEELKNCYGDRIAIIPVGKEENVVKEMAGVQAEVTEKVKTEELKETVNGEQPTTKSEDEAGTPDVIAAELDDLLKDFEGNSNVPEIKDFLEGKTDKLPEGTEVITKEEAEKLEGKTKVSTEKEVKKNNKRNSKKASNKKE